MAERLSERAWHLSALRKDAISALPADLSLEKLRVAYNLMARYLNEIKKDCIFDPQAHQWLKDVALKVETLVLVDDANEIVQKKKLNAIMFLVVTVPFIAILGVLEPLLGTLAIVGIVLIWRRIRPSLHERELADNLLAETQQSPIAGKNPNDPIAQSIASPRH